MLFAGGDWNVRLADDQGDAEAETLLDLFRRWRIQAIPGPPITRRATRRGERAADLDHVAVSEAAAWRFAARALWHGPLSDHAMVRMAATDATTAAGPPRCTPSAIAALPPAALRDLRLRFAYLEREFGCAEALPGPAGGAAPQGPGPAGCLAPNDPLWAILGLPVGDDGPADPSAPAALALRPLLAYWGRTYLEAVVHSWWRTWRRRAPRRDPVLAELARVAAAPEPCEPNPALALWLGQLDQPPGPVAPAEAARLLPIARRLLETAARAGAPEAGRSVRCGPAPEWVRAGRSALRRGGPLRHLQGPDGRRITSPAAIEQALWDSRRAVWRNVPDMPPAARDVLDAYFHGRGPVEGLPAGPTVDLARLRRLVRESGGSAPGVDGIPYEALAPGATFVAELLGQYWAAAMTGPGELARALGPSEDLLVWIPKAPPADRPGLLRPLQLPTCLRRLFGALVARELASRVEPRLSQDQAAVAGGSCRHNIQAAFAHLHSASRPDPLPPAAPPLFSALLGDTAVAAWEAIHHTPEGGLAGEPAILFADQSKAFERVSHAWLAEVLRRWGLPGWLRWAVMALVAGRAVRGVACGRLGPRRVLYCSIGMGGTASALVWCVAYDPVVAAVAAVAGCACPTYVDDTAALVRGPRQVWVAEIALMAATRCAGLHVDGHTCTALVLLDGPEADAARHRLRSLPVQTSRTAGGAWRLVGLPASLMATLAGIPADADWAWAEAGRCGCGLKTALVPARGLEAWAAALADSPLGGAAVQPRWPYLGATVAATTAADGPGRVADPIGEAAAVTEGTWRAPLSKVVERAEDVAAARGSPGHRAALWNCYVGSVMLYPAQVAPLDDAGRALVERAFRRGLFLAGWAPVWLPGALHAMFGVAGCPRVPAVAADAAAAMAWCKDGGWGPPCLAEAAHGIWSRVRRWAERATGPSPGHGEDARRRAAERIAHLPVALGGRVPPAHLRRAGGGLLPRHLVGLLWPGRAGLARHTLGRAALAAHRWQGVGAPGPLSPLHPGLACRAAAGRGHAGRCPRAAPGGPRRPLLCPLWGACGSRRPHGQPDDARARLLPALPRHPRHGRAAMGVDAHPRRAGRPLPARPEHTGPCPPWPPRRRRPHDPQPARALPSLRARGGRRGAPRPLVPRGRRGMGGPGRRWPIGRGHC